MKNKILILLALTYLLFSCKDKEEIKTFQLSCISTMQDNEILGNPSDLILIDSALIVLDKIGKEPFHLYNTISEKYVASTGRYGEGPLEYNNLGKLYTLDNYIYVYDVNVKRCYKLQLDSFNLRNVSTKAIWQGDTLIHFYTLPMKNGDFFCFGSYKDNRIKIVDRNGQLKESLFEYPYRDNTERQLKPKLRSLAYRGPADKKPNEDSFVQVMSNSDMIFIYQTINNKVEVKEIINSYPTYKTEEDETGYSVPISAHTPHCYLDVATTNRYIYLLYSGKTYADKGMDSFYGEQIFVYDWKGTPICKLDLDLSAKLICPSPDDDFLYTISLNPDYKVTKYRLPAMK